MATYIFHTLIRDNLKLTNFSVSMGIFLEFIFTEMFDEYFCISYMAFSHITEFDWLPGRKNGKKK